MKKISSLLAIFAFILVSNLVNAQISISDVSRTADASSVLDVYSTSKGFLAPRMTSAQRTGISSPATGLLVFDTDNASYWYYDGSAWTEIAYGGNLWTRNVTDTYLTNTGDNVGIGTNTPGIYKLYVTDPVNAFSVSRFDSQIEVWSGPNVPDRLLVDLNDFGVRNGVVQVYDNGNSRIRLLANGASFLNGGFVGVGLTAPQSRLHVSNPVNVPALRIENPSNNQASLRYQITNFRNFSTGIAFDPNGTDHNYKICDQSFLTSGLGYNDPNTLYEIHTENPKVGITDINHQSRARAFQFNMGQMWGQIIPFALWQPVDYDFITYDEHNEWLTAPVGTSPAGGPATSFFTATEDGYYQVNARTDFFLMNPFYHEDIHNPNYPGYVSIAIYVNNQMVSQGNKLQGADNNGIGQWNDLKNNLAPNVSDVIYLQAGQTVQIYVWQDLWGNGLPLVPGTTQTYVSIHKVS